MSGWVGGWTPGAQLEVELQKLLGSHERGLGIGLGVRQLPLKLPEPERPTCTE